MASLDNSIGDSAFEAHLADLFGDLGTGERPIPGVSDSVPPDVSLTRVEQIRRRIEAFGPVRPNS